MTLPSPIQIVAAIVRAVPAVIEHLSEETKDAIKAAPGYEAIRNEMWAAIYDAVDGYLSGTGYVTTFRAVMSAAISKAYIETADLAYEAGGGELPMDDETANWARSELDAQLGFVDSLFENLRDLRKEGNADAIGQAFARANGYAGSLDGFYSGAMMRGGENVTLEFGGDDGKESCPDCQRMKGKRRKVKYILENNLIPKPGNNTYQCNGYNCEHFWFNPKTGEEYRV